LRLNESVNCARIACPRHVACERLPEASDPDSEIAAGLQEMKRDLRKLRGRPRKRQKKTQK